MAKKMDTLDKLYMDLLKDLYSSEKQIAKALPKMAKKAQSADLQRAFNEHLKQTERQAERIEKIFSEMDGSPRGKKCIGMEGLIKEGEEIMKETDKEAMDAALIAAAQKVEHYEIASYGTARTWAQRMGDERAARMLQETLDEESKTNEKLTTIAESHANMEAQQR